jgi:hypothetical protein
MTDGRMLCAHLARDCRYRARQCAISDCSDRLIDEFSDTLRWRTKMALASSRWPTRMSQSRRDKWISSSTRTSETETKTVELQEWIRVLGWQAANPIGLARRPSTGPKQYSGLRRGKPIRTRLPSISFSLSLSCVLWVTTANMLYGEPSFTGVDIFIRAKADWCCLAALCSILRYSISTDA